jgi:hypothetical protein
VHRRPVGRPRWIAALAAVIILAGCIVPWYTAGGNADLPAIPIHAFDGSGIVVFVVALAVLALVALPYASDAPVAIDRTLSWVVLLIAGVAGFGLFIVEHLHLIVGDVHGAFPDRAPGLWLAAAGLVVLARGVLEIHETTRAR